MKNTRIIRKPQTKEDSMQKSALMAKLGSESGAISLLASPRDQSMIQGDLVLSKARIFNVFEQVDAEISHNSLIKE